MDLLSAEQLREYENQVRDLWEAGELPWLTHLTDGNESWLVRYFHENFNEGDWVFASHRCHFSYLLSGGRDFIEKIKKGASMFLYSERFVCSAIVAGSCSIAAGKALAIKLKGGSEHVHCMLGDGATDQGAFWEALRFSMGQNLPITFVIEDNNGQCGVTPGQRWGDYWPLIQIVAKQNKFIRMYSYKSSYPHAGTLSKDGKPTRPPIKIP